MRLRSVTLLLFVMLWAETVTPASTWYVQGDAAAGGNGSRSRPFATLEQVETASRAGDVIRVVASARPLDGGIQLKDGQRLIGLGELATRAAAGPRATITNTNAARYNGDAIRLARNNVAQNIHLDGAAREPDGVAVV